MANRAVGVKDQEDRLRAEIERGSSLSKVLKLKKWEEVVGELGGGPMRETHLLAGRVSRGATEQRRPRSVGRDAVFREMGRQEKGDGLRASPPLRASA